MSESLQGYFSATAPQSCTAYVPSRSPDPGVEAKLANRGETRDAPLGGFPKRAMDIAVAVVALVVLSPLIAVTALLVRMTMGAPVIFAHRRIGCNGRPFRCYKFRTMVTDAEARLQRVLAANPELAREWREQCKLGDDPRITPFGRILRKTSIDELPQLLNVLRGDMSCVGPRPVVDDELRRYGRRRAGYLAARPGITGLWQVSGRSRTVYSRRVALDWLYVRRWSLRLDLLILLRTIPAVLRVKDSA